MNKIKNAIVAAAVAVLTGCISNPVTTITSSIPVEQGKYSVLAEEVTGTHTEVYWLFFSFGMGGSGQRNAYRDAMRKVPGADGLVTMSVDDESFILIPFVLPSFYTTRVTGTPIKLGHNN